MRRLLVRPGAIGDCIAALPAIERLRADYTEVWISRPAVPLIDCADLVRALPDTGIDLMGVGDLPLDKALQSRLESFDEIVSWYGANRPEFREALEGLGVRCRFLQALPPSEYEGHAVDFFAAQVGAPAGLPPRLYVMRDTARDAVVIHPFSGSRKKNWPLERYRELASRLPCPVEWTAGPEEELPEAVRFENLRELAEWMAGARFYIGNDSGITHLAVATGVKTLTIFGPASTPRWFPRGKNVEVFRTDSLNELTVEQVLEAVNRLLG